MNPVGKLNCGDEAAPLCSTHTTADLLAHPSPIDMRQWPDLPLLHLPPGASPSASLNPGPGVGAQFTALWRLLNQILQLCKVKYHEFHKYNKNKIFTKSLRKSGASIVSSKSLLNFFLQLHPKPNSGLPASLLRSPSPRLHTLER